ncbi:hypothetical protein [Paenibacillus larvae]|nr:hypothetical protein [Paenibacillus larvae]
MDKRDFVIWFVGSATWTVVLFFLSYVGYCAALALGIPDSP